MWRGLIVVVVGALSVLGLAECGKQDPQAHDRDTFYAICYVAGTQKGVDPQVLEQRCRAGAEREYPRP